MTLAAFEMQSRDSPARDSDNRPDVIVPILRSGILAREFCRSHARANVDAVFERSLYLRAGDEFICLGQPAIGNGPLTLIADLRPLMELALQRGRSALITSRNITFGNAVRFDLDHCEPWSPPRWPVSPSTTRLADTYAQLAQRSAIEAPQEGFARHVFDAHEPVTSLPPLARVTCERIADFAGWLVAVLNGDRSSVENFPAPVAGLIGLGPGLTPSGDDFLVGVLASLDSLGEKETHAVLARAIIDASPALTSPLSRCLLNATAAGHMGENLHRAVSSVMMGDIDAAVAAVGKIGHSSGWDMMAGIGTTIRIVAAARVRS